MKKIVESEMNFEFNEDQIFEIETSNLHKTMGEGIRTVEFVLRLKENELDFVEAKSSSPKPIKENKEKFETYIRIIEEKFIHSFNMYLSAILNRNLNDEIDSKFFAMDISKVNIKFILIIKGHEIEWLQPISEALYKNMKNHMKIWKSSVVLMNEELAQEYKIVK